MPSGIMNVEEALRYSKEKKIGGLIVEGRYLRYRNSSGNWSKIKITKNLLLYHRGKGKWAVYSIERDKKIISHYIPPSIKNKKKYMNYGDLNPEKTINKTKKAKIVPGKTKGKVLIKKKKLPSGGGINSL